MHFGAPRQGTDQTYDGNESTFNHRVSVLKQLTNYQIGGTNVQGQIGDRSMCAGTTYMRYCRVIVGTAPKTWQPHQSRCIPSSLKTARADLGGRMLVILSGKTGQHKLRLGLRCV